MPEQKEREEFQIDDPEELSQKTRIREILQRRADVIDSRDQAFDALMFGQASEQQALSFYYRRIQSLIIELWTQFKNEDIDAGKEYLTEKVVDKVNVPPPNELRNANNMAPGQSVPKPKTRTITGLLWFINNDPVITAEFAAHTWDPPGESTFIEEQSIPPRTLDKALLRCMEFIDETGIDVDFQPDKGDHGFDYSDILENGPPGQADDMTVEEIREYHNE